jgi:hypothetical protein
LTEWWSSIPPKEKLYWFLAFPFTALFIIQTIMTLVGLGYNGDASGFEIDIDGDGIPDIPSDNSNYNIQDSAAPFKLLTLRNFIIFFTVFAWSGIAFAKTNMNLILVFVVSVVIGIIVAAVVSGIFYFITGFTESGTLDIKNSVNCIGEVYITIPGRRKDSGKVMVTVQGSLRELDAITDGNELVTGTKVIVTNIVDNRILLVEKYN